MQGPESLNWKPTFFRPSTRTLTRPESRTSLAKHGSKQHQNVNDPKVQSAKTMQKLPSPLHDLSMANSHRNKCPWTLEVVPGGFEVVNDNFFVYKML